MLKKIIIKKPFGGSILITLTLLLLINAAYLM